MSWLAEDDRTDAEGEACGLEKLSWEFTFGGGFQPGAHAETIGCMSQGRRPAGNVATVRAIPGASRPKTESHRNVFK
jgi:hypothetical protein